MRGICTPAAEWLSTLFALTVEDGTAALARETVVTALWDTPEDAAEALGAVLDVDREVGAGLGLNRSEATGPADGDANETLLVPAAHCA